MAVSSSAIRAGRAFVELFADDTKLVRGLRRAEGKVRAFGDKLKNMGRRMLSVGISASAPLAISTKVFAGFDDQMRAVQAVIGATGREVDMLTEKAKHLGRTTSFSAAQVAAGMLELGRAGFSPKQIDAAIASVLDLSRATGTELPEASNIAANTLRSFSLEADQMGRVADVMTATANNSAQTLTDLGEAMKYTAPVAAEYGLTLEETAKALGALANFGIKGSMAGTTMKNILLRLADPAIRGQVEALGVSVADAGGDLRNVSDILRDVGQAVDGMPNAKKLEIFNRIFGMRAIAGGAKLTAAEFDRLNKSIDGATGTANKTAQVMDSGIGGAFRRLYSAVEGIAIAIGDSLAQPLSDMADWLGKAAGSITQWVKNHKQLIVTAMQVILVVMGVGAALVTLGFVFGALATAIGGIISVVTAAIAVFKIIAAVIAVLVSPIGLVIAAFAALGAYILYATGMAGKALAWLGEKFLVLRDDAVGAYQGIADALAAGDIALAAKILWLTLKMEWQRGINYLEKAWLNFRNFFIRIGYDAWHGLIAIVQVVWHGLEVGWVETAAFFKKLWSNLLSFFANLWQNMVAIARKAWQWIKGLFSKKARKSTATVNAEIDREKEAAIKRIQNENEREIAAAEAERQRRRRQSSQLHQATMAQIGQENLDAHKALDDEYAAKMADNESDLAEARKEWEDALAEAKSKRETSEKAAQKKGPEGLEDPEALIAKAQEAVAGLSALGGVEGAIEVQSTFNAVAATRGLSSGGPVDKIKDRVAEIDRNIGLLVQEAKKGGIQFA